ncbi:MAG: hypothetical protein GX557_03155, partial [Chloroflexi bacterium]|nr:hypothetical protein [Chloroflexota bacterium]
MSIHLCVAPAAAGKTAYAVSRVRAAATLRRQVTVCVASQLQRGSWHARLAKAGGTLGARVVTFGGLYRQCLNRVGLAVTELDPPVQQRVLRMVLAQAGLEHYAALRNSPGFAQVLRRLCAELKAAAITPEQFANGVRDLGGEPRLAELATLYATYQQVLVSRGWADEEHLGLLTLDVLRSQPELGCDCALFVLDGFDNLTTLQLEVLELLAQRAHEALITLTGSIGGERRGDVHRRFDDTRARIEQALGIAAEPLPAAAVPSQSTLAQLERRLYTGWLGGPSDGSVELIEAADRAGEVRAALRWLKARILVDGKAPGEVALLARNVAPYRPYIQQTADELGLPVRLLDGQPLAGTPVIAALLDLLQLLAPAAGGAGPALTRRLVVEAWRSPYLDLSPADIGPGDAEALDNVARQGRVLGGLSQWREAFERILGRREGLDREEDESPVELADHARVSALWQKLQRFVEWLTPPDGNAGLRALVQWLETLIDPEGEGEAVSLRVRERATAARGVAAEWDLEALRALKSVLRGLVWAELNLRSGDAADFAAFYRDLRAAVEVSTVRLSADAANDAIYVADVVQARGV